MPGKRRSRILMACLTSPIPAAYHFAHSSENLVRTAVGKNVRFGNDAAPRRLRESQPSQTAHCLRSLGPLSPAARTRQQPVTGCNGFSLQGELHSPCGFGGEWYRHSAAALLSELPSQYDSGLLSSTFWVEYENSQSPRIHPASERFILILVRRGPLGTTCERDGMTFGDRFAVMAAPQVLHRTVKTPIGLLGVGPDLMPSPSKAARSAAPHPQARATAMTDYIRYKTLKRVPLIETLSPGRSRDARGNRTPRSLPNFWSLSDSTGIPCGHHSTAHAVSGVLLCALPR